MSESEVVNQAAPEEIETPEAVPEAPEAALEAPVATDASGDVTTPPPEAAKPGEAGIRSVGIPAADAEALNAYPYAELRQYAIDLGVEPHRSKSETVRRILEKMYPPQAGRLPVGVAGDVVPQAMSARVARIHGQ